MSRKRYHKVAPFGQPVGLPLGCPIGSPCGVYAEKPYWMPDVIYTPSGHVYDSSALLPSAAVVGLDMFDWPIFSPVRYADPPVRCAEPPVRYVPVYTPAPAPAPAPSASDIRIGEGPDYIIINGNTFYIPHGSRTITVEGGAVTPLGLGSGYRCFAREQV